MPRKDWIDEEIHFLRAHPNGSSVAAAKPRINSADISLIKGHIFPDVAAFANTPLATFTYFIQF